MSPFWFLLMMLLVLDHHPRRPDVVRVGSVVTSLQSWVAWLAWGMVMVGLTAATVVCDLANRGSL